MKKFSVFALVAVLSLSIVSLAFAMKKDVEFPTVGDEGKVVFSHENHTETQKFKCGDCHEGVFKKGVKTGYTMKDMEDGKYCGTCHNGEKAFSVKAADSCAKCHKK